jgi:hypothetical protein
MEHTVNLDVGLVLAGASLMPEIVADPLSPSCYHLFSGPRNKESQGLGPDLFFSSRARTRAGGRSKRGGCSKRGGRGNLTAARDNLYLNLAADSLQAQQTVMDDSISDCG